MKNFWETVWRYNKMFGPKRSIQKALQTIIGVKRDEIDVLYFLLNEYVDITKLPPTKNVELRSLQLCVLSMMRIIEKLCEKYQLQYWLDGGSMLGAVRHQGFIPWDDDMDVCMLRKDFDQFVTTVGSELERLGFTVHEIVGYMIKVGYKEPETGICIDIFPVDECISDKSADDQYEDFSKKIAKVHSYYRKNRDHITRELLAEYKKKVIPDIPNGTIALLYHGPEFVRTKFLISEKSYYFPLKRAKFEKYEFNIPAHPERFLTQYYGCNYMDFPHGGISFHTRMRESQKGLSNTRTNTLLQVQELFNGIIGRL